jgi:hypothetical protein
MSILRAKAFFHKSPELLVLLIIVFLTEYFVWGELAEINAYLRLITLAVMSSVSLVIGYFIYHESQ